MTHAEFLSRHMRPAAAWVEQAIGLKPTTDALRILLAIAGQESNCDHRYQVLAGGAPGAARGHYQFEQGNMASRAGVTGVMTHKRTAPMAASLCRAANVRFESGPIWRAIEGHDGLAYGFARLLLLTDPYEIPTEEQEAWRCYLRVWRPGKPHAQVWPGHFKAAGIAVAAETA